nr:hypothetical protein CFP56_61816 [Quercus suber]
MVEDSVDTKTSQAAKLSWLKSKINLEVVPTSNEDSKNLLIGKILSSKAFSKSLVKEILIKAWNVINDVEVSAVDKNIFMFSFKHELIVSEVDFSFTEFWIQIHGLPLNRRSKENVLKIGSMAGRALDTNLVGPGSGVWSRNVRVRVEIDVSCPLVPGVISGFYGKWLKADNDKFRLGINLENLLNPNRLEMEATTSDSQSLVPNNRSNLIQNAMDSWDAIIAREASGTRDETVETLEQCEMVTTLQANGTDMEKATEDLSKSQASSFLTTTLQASSFLTTTQLPRWNIDHKIMGSPKHFHSDPAPSKPNNRIQKEIHSLKPARKPKYLTQKNENDPNLLTA